MIIENRPSEKEAFIRMTSDISSTLYSSVISTPIGDMLTISDEDKLHLLDFVDGKQLHRKLQKLRNAFGCEIMSFNATPILSITEELHQYFMGTLKTFLTPIHISGSPFQKAVWSALQKIPYGETVSYTHQAEAIGTPKSVRAVANANGHNNFAILIPCHRIVSRNGSLGGYSGGTQKKSWLLQHEKQNNY